MPSAIVTSASLGKHGSPASAAAIVELTATVGALITVRVPPVLSMATGVVSWATIAVCSAAALVKLLAVL